MRLVRQPVQVAPAVNGAGAPAATASAATPQRECRPYTAATTLTGNAMPVQGIACRDGDGTWRLVSEAPAR
jgi:surface antigen